MLIKIKACTVHRLVKSVLHMNDCATFIFLYCTVTEKKLCYRKERRFC